MKTSLARKDWGKQESLATKASPCLNLPYYIWQYTDCRV